MKRALRVSGVVGVSVAIALVGAACSSGSSTPTTKQPSSAKNTQAPANTPSGGNFKKGKSGEEISLTFSKATTTPHSGGVLAGCTSCPDAPTDLVIAQITLRNPTASNIEVPGFTRVLLTSHQEIAGGGYGGGPDDLHNGKDCMAQGGDAHTLLPHETYTFPEDFCWLAKDPQLGGVGISQLAYDGVTYSVPQ